MQAASPSIAGSEPHPRRFPQDFVAVQRDDCHALPPHAKVQDHRNTRDRPLQITPLFTCFFRLHFTAGFDILSSVINGF